MNNIRKIKELLKEEYPRLYNRINRNIENGWGGQDEDIEDYLERAVKKFSEYDQGSLSFTATALQHAGYDYPFGVLESIDSVLSGKE